MSTPTRRVEALPVQQIAQVDGLVDGPRWLVRSLWTEQAVGFIGGPPKSCKSWLGLDLAVSVASATPCLGGYQVDQPGPVLIYLAEDDPAAVRYRVAGLCAHRGLALNALNLQLITVRGWRLDVPEHRQGLEATIKQLRPRLLLLDPLVRLHRLDENSASEISGLLGFLREIQIIYATAIVLVHHMSKRSRAQLGYALRGSSDLFAWADSNAYLLRQDQQLTLTLEHRGAPATDPIPLVLANGPPGAGPHLEVASEEHREQPRPDAALAEAVRRALAAATGPLTRTALRQALHINNQRLGDVLLQLEQHQLICRTGDGWANANPTPTPRPPPSPAAGAAADAAGAPARSAPMDQANELGTERLQHTQSTAPASPAQLSLV